MLFRKYQNSSNSSITLHVPTQPRASKVVQVLPSCCCRGATNSWQDLSRKEGPDRQPIVVRQLIVVIVAGNEISWGLAPVDGTHQPFRRFPLGLPSTTRGRLAPHQSRRRLQKRCHLLVTAALHPAIAEGLLAVLLTVAVVVLTALACMRVSIIQECR